MRSLQRPGTAGTGAARRVEIGRALCGITHGGVRWKTRSCATSGAIAGTYWIAEAPCRSLATRLPLQIRVVVPARGVKAGPSKRSSPGKSGILGSISGPVPETSTFARDSPGEVSSRQRSPLVPPALHLGVQPQVRPYAEVLDDAPRYARISRWRE